MGSFQASGHADKLTEESCSVKSIFRFTLKSFVTFQIFNCSEGMHRNQSVEIPLKISLRSMFKYCGVFFLLFFYCSVGAEQYS